MAAKAKEDISTEIARLNQAVMLLEKLAKTGKFTSPSLPNHIRELINSTTQRLQNAERDNASVYLKRILPFNELPVISGAQLVKLVEVTYLDASKEHIFEDLIPEPITKALSRYSEMVDNLIRKLTAKLEGATDEARLRLKQYELPEILDAVTSVNPSLLREDVKKDLNEVDEFGGLAHLDDVKHQLDGLKASSLQDLNNIESDLDQDAAADAALREQHRGSLNAPPSASQALELRRLIGGYKENVAKADKSDAVVAEKLEKVRERLVFLSIEKCTERLPKLEAGMVNTSDLEPQTLVANLRNSLDQMTVVSDERAGIDESLKETKNRDNLLPKLSATGVGSHEDLFREEIKKYDEMVQDVDENVRKQQDLLEYIRRALDDFKRTFDVTVWHQNVDTYCKDIKADIVSFYRLRDNLGEGLRFYMSLKDAIDVLRQQVGDYILSKRLQREDQLEMIKTQEAAAQKPPPPAAAYVPPPTVPSGGSDYSAPPMPPEAPPLPQPEPPVHVQSPVVQTHAASSQSDVEANYGYPSGSQTSDAPPNRLHDAMADSPNPYIPPPVPPPHYDAYQQQSGYPNRYGYQQPAQPPSGYGYQGYQGGYTQPPQPPQPPQPYQDAYHQTDKYQKLPPHEAYQQPTYNAYQSHPPPGQGYVQQGYYSQQQPYLNDPYQKPLPQGHGYPPQDYQQPHQTRPQQQQPYDPYRQYQGHPYPGQDYYQNQ